MLAMNTFIKRLLAVADPEQMKVCLRTEPSLLTLFDGLLTLRFCIQPIIYNAN